LTPFLFVTARASFDFISGEISRNSVETSITLGQDGKCLQSIPKIPSACGGKASSEVGAFIADFVGRTEYGKPAIMPF
jgi:hypothetical protein